MLFPVGPPAGLQILEQGAKPLALPLVSAPLGSQLPADVLAEDNHRALQQPPPAQQTETHNTVGITSLRSSDAGLADPEEVSPNAGQRTFRAMLRGSSRGQDNRSDNRLPRICATNNEWRRRCPWAARLQRVERLAAETERLVESVERLGVRFHGAEVGASRHLAELFTDSP